MARLFPVLRRIIEQNADDAGDDKEQGDLGASNDRDEGHAPENQPQPPIRTYRGAGKAERGKRHNRYNYRPDAVKKRLNNSQTPIGSIEKGNPEHDKEGRENENDA